MPLFFALLFTAFSTLLWIWTGQRAGLEYNESGRHFDPQEGVVYDEASLTVLFVFAIVCSVVSIGLWICVVVRRRNRIPTDFR